MPIDKRTELTSCLSRCIPRKHSKLKALKGVWPKIDSMSQCADLGTGKGSIIKHLLANGKWTFVDSDPDELEIAKKLIIDGNYVVQNLNDFIFGSEKRWDLLSLIDVIMYIEKPHTLLKTLYKQLKPGGVLVLAYDDSQETSWLYFLRKKLGIISAIKYKKNINSQSIIQTLTETGFQRIEIRRFAGPITMLFQSLIDFYVLNGNLFQKKSLTRGLNLTGTITSNLLLKLRVLRILTIAVVNLDQILFFLPRYGSVIKARV